jgi:hypothetical protein
MIGGRNMKVRKILLLLLVCLMVVSFIGCKGGEEETPEPTATPVPTDTPEPTPTPTPTPEPTPDPDEGLDAILYRFALEGEEAFFRYGMVQGVMNADLDYTDEGLTIIVLNQSDPYFTIPLPDGAIDITEYPIFKMLLKHNAGVTTGEFYVGFDGEAITGVQQNYTYTVDKGEDWQEIYIDWSEKKPEAQTITTFRADILGNPPVDSEIVIDFFGFFKTMEDAENYIPPNRR